MSEPTDNGAPEEFSQEFTTDAQPPADERVEDVSEGERTEAASEPGAETAGEQTERPLATLRIEIAVVAGDLSISGGASQARLSVDDEDEYEGYAHDLMASAHGNLVRIARVPADAELFVPDGAEVVIGSLNGDLTADGLDGLIEINRQQGDVEARDIAALFIHHMDGDLDGAHLGDLRVRHISGAVTLDDILSAPLFEHIDGDFEGRHLAGFEMKGSIGGDAEFDHCEYVAINGAIGGDLEISQCPGNVLLGPTGGDLAVSDVGALRFGPVGGDAVIERVAGELRGEVIGGDARLRDIGGPVRINVVSGDLQAKNIPSGLGAVQVGADAALDTPIASQAEYRIRAGGDILFRVRGEINARFVAQSGGEIRTRLPLTVERGRRRNLVGVLGDGSATVTLHSGGDIVLTASDGGDPERGSHSSDFDFRDFGDFGDFGAMASDFAERFASNFGPGFARDVASAFADAGASWFGARRGRRSRPGPQGRGDNTMTDDTTNRPTDDEQTGPDANPSDPTGQSNARTWEGSVGQHRFRVRVEREPGRAGFHFKGPYTDEHEGAEGAREFNLQWERGAGARTSGEYEQRLNEMRDRAEQVARQAAEEARKFADAAAKRARETDWEAVGREVRTTIERAMSDLEEAFNRVRGDWGGPSRSTGGAGASAGATGGSQRVRIEQDDNNDVFGEGASASSSASAMSQDDRDAQRRDILEQLRSGAITLDEAERRLNSLR